MNDKSKTEQTLNCIQCSWSLFRYTDRIGWTAAMPNCWKDHTSRSQAGPTFWAAACCSHLKLRITYESRRGKTDGSTTHVNYVCNVLPRIKPHQCCFSPLPPDLECVEVCPLRTNLVWWWNLWMQPEQASSRRAGVTRLCSQWLILCLAG